MRSLLIIIITALLLPCLISANWPTYIHKRIIKKALKDRLSRAEIKTVIKASNEIDAFKNQSKGSSYMHYMRGPQDDYEDAKNYAVEFLSEKQIQFIYESDSIEALYRLGQGIHTLTDSLSPSHEGCEVWNGMTPGIKRWVGAFVHLSRELNFFRKDEDRVKQCIENTRLYYDNSLVSRKAAILQNKMDTVSILLNSDSVSVIEEEVDYDPEASLPDNRRIKVLPLAKSNPVQYTFNVPLQTLRVSVVNNFREYKKRYRNMKLIVREDSTVNLKLKEVFDQPGNELDFYLFSFDNIGKSHTYYYKKRTLPYYAYFQVHLSSISANQTKVEIITIDPHVKTGRSIMTVLPHLLKMQKVIPAPPTSIEEYEILKKIGKGLGEKNMPSLLLPER